MERRKIVWVAQRILDFVRNPLTHKVLLKVVGEIRKKRHDPVIFVLVWPFMRGSKGQFSPLTTICMATTCGDVKHFELSWSAPSGGSNRSPLGQFYCHFVKMKLKQRRGYPPKQQGVSSTWFVTALRRP